MLVIYYQISIIFTRIQSITCFKIYVTFIKKIYACIDILFTPLCCKSVIFSAESKCKNENSK